MELVWATIAMAMRWGFSSTLRQSPVSELMPHGFIDNASLGFGFAGGW